MVRATLSGMQWTGWKWVTLWFEPGAGMQSVPAMTRREARDYADLLIEAGLTGVQVRAV